MTKDEQSLQALMLDDEWPAKLEKWLSGVNMLDVLGVARYEIRHSNILAWLLSPNGSHGFGTAFFDRFLKRACQLSDSQEKTMFLLHDWRDAFVTREWGNAKRRLDILVESSISAQKSLVIAIENKIDSKDQKYQLDDYEREVLSAFPKKHNRGRHLFVYLTPAGDDPINAHAGYGCGWISVSYLDVLSSLDDVMASKPLVPKNVMALISDYRSLLRRNIVSDFNLEKCCQSLYEKHKEAFDLVYRHADMGGVVGDARKTLKVYLEKFCENSGGKYIFTGNNKGNQSALSFQSKAMNELLRPLPAGVRGAWANEDVYYYWFDVNPYNERVRLVVEFGPLNVDTSEDSVMLNLGRIINPKKNLEGGTFRRMTSFPAGTIGDDFNEKSLIAKAESAIQTLGGRESKWISEFRRTV